MKKIISFFVITMFLISAISVFATQDSAEIDKSKLARRGKEASPTIKAKLGEAMEKCKESGLTVEQCKAKFNNQVTEGKKLTVKQKPQ